MKVSVYIGTSIDGYIARPDGTIDWLNDANGLVPEGEDCGYGAFMDSVDTLIMGRKTFEQVLTFGEWVYGDTPVIVLSRNSMTLPSHLPDTVSHSSETPRVLLECLSTQGVGHVYVDGGYTIQSFLEDDLIDEVTITVVPVVIGSGIPLFSSLKTDLKLCHVSTKAYDFGFIQTKYAVPKSSSEKQ